MLGEIEEWQSAINIVNEKSNNKKDVQIMKRILSIILPVILTAIWLTTSLSQTETSVSEKLTPTEWLMANVPSPSSRQGGIDPILESLILDNFKYPSADTASSDTIKWVKVVSKEGELQTSKPSGLLYCAAKVVVDVPTSAVLTPLGVGRIFINGKQYPGELYNMDFARVPVRFDKGENIIVISCRVWRDKQPVIRFAETQNEIEFSTKDLTLPDFRVGDSDEQYIGVPILNMIDEPLINVTAEVVANQYFASTSYQLPALAPLSVTKVPFLLKPKTAFIKTGEKIPVSIRIVSNSLNKNYDYSLELTTIGRTETYSRTFLSRIDNSVQYFGVNPPKNFDQQKKYALTLSLHGATGEARGQVGAYDSKDWCYVVAPTNRRPMGFDWEDWGRLDAIEVLNNVTQLFNIDGTRIYLTGHSMGGHGVWHVGTMYPDRFATLAPSAGWISFVTYAGETSEPRNNVEEAILRSMAGGATSNYISNIADKGIYILHGEKDEEVPIDESKTMYDKLKPIAKDVIYDEIPGVGHWWDNSPEKPGVDCLDWDPMFKFIGTYKLEIELTDFNFTTPSPWVNGEYSFLKILSEITPYKDCKIESKRTDNVINLQCDNILSLSLDCKKLSSAGVNQIKIGDQLFEIPETDFTLVYGDGDWKRIPYQGKQPGIHGPFKEVFFNPFCFVYSDEVPVYKEFASYLVSSWSIRANGFSFAIPISKLTDDIRQNYNIVYLGIPTSLSDENSNLPLSLSKEEIKIGVHRYTHACVMLCYPDRKTNRLNGYIFGTKDFERYISTTMPLRSGVGIPDYLIWDEKYSVGGWMNSLTAGFFNADWKFSEEFFREQGK